MIINRVCKPIIPCALTPSCVCFVLGEMRNDLYITLEKGEFEKGGKTVARNVEVTVYALDADGQILRVFSFTQALIVLLYMNTSVLLLVWGMNL